MPEVSTDTKVLLLNERLRDLQAKRAQVRPALYLFLALVLGLFIFVFHGLLSILCFILAIASFLAMFTAISKGSSLDNQIRDAQHELDAMLK